MTARLKCGHNLYMPSTDTTVHPAMLNAGDFIAEGQVVSVSRPRTDFPFTTPATVWEIEYVEEPGDDAPILRTRVSDSALIERW